MSNNDLWRIRIKLDDPNDSYSVLVDPEETDLVEWGKLWNQNKCKRDWVEDEVGGLVVRVEACEEEENDGDNRQELPGRRVLQPVIQLLPMGQTTNGTLIEG